MAELDAKSAIAVMTLIQYRDAIRRNVDALAEEIIEKHGLPRELMALELMSAGLRVVCPEHTDVVIERLVLKHFEAAASEARLLRDQMLSAIASAGVS